nr:unnamed protein product [Callosobruchus analis]
MTCSKCRKSICKQQAEQTFVYNSYTTPLER